MTRNDSAELQQLAASIAGQAAQGVVHCESPWAIVSEQGLDRIGIPEDQGGLSGTVDDICHLVTALAQHGWDGPVVEASVAQMTIARRSRSVSDRRTTLVFADRESLAIRDSAATGHLPSVPWTDDAEAVLVVSPDRVLEFTIDQLGVHRDSVASLHGTPLADLRLDEVPFQTVGGDRTAAEATEWFGLLSSAALLGSLRATYAMTRQFVLTREQFGRPLARINAVGANLARMRTEVLMAEVGLQRAVEAAGAGEFDPAGRAAICAARVSAGRAATTVAHLAHRLHGAMGITLEYSLHTHTTRLWELRDSGISEAAWADRLGGYAVQGSEAGLWEVLSA